MDEAGPVRDAEVEGRLAELDELLARVEQIPGPAGELALEAVAALAEVYGAALTRAMAYAAAGTPVSTVAADPLLGALLALHGIHPEPVEARIGQVLDDVRQQLGTSGQVTLTGITDGVAELRVSPGGGCGAPAPAEVEEVLRGTVLAAAPELAEVRVVAQQAARAPAFVPLESLLQTPAGMPR